MSRMDLTVEIQYLKDEISKLKARVDGLTSEIEEMKSVKGKKVQNGSSPSSSEDGRNSDEIAVGSESKPSKKKRKFLRKSPRTIAKILANLPNPEKVNNPIASFTNYCNHYLQAKCDFVYTHLENKDHHFQIFVNDCLLSNCSDRRKVLAKERAAIEALKYLQNNVSVLQSLVEDNASTPEEHVTE
jgi:hypothetical protein